MNIGDYKYLPREVPGQTRGLCLFSKYNTKDLDLITKILQKYLYQDKYEVNLGKGLEIMELHVHSHLINLDLLKQVSEELKYKIPYFKLVGHLHDNKDVHIENALGELTINIVDVTFETLFRKGKYLV